MVSSTELFCLTRLKGTGSVGAGKAKHAKFTHLHQYSVEISTHSNICRVLHTYVHTYMYICI